MIAVFRRNKGNMKASAFELGLQRQHLFAILWRESLWHELDEIRAEFPRPKKTAEPTPEWIERARAALRKDKDDGLPEQRDRAHGAAQARGGGAPHTNDVAREEDRDGDGAGARVRASQLAALDRGARSSGPCRAPGGIVNARAVDRMVALGPAHLVVASQALIGRLRLIHERFALERGRLTPAQARALVAAHVEHTEALLNVLSVIEADGAGIPALPRLRAGLERALESARDLGFGAVGSVESREVEGGLLLPL